MKISTDILRFAPLGLVVITGFTAAFLITTSANAAKQSFTCSSCAPAHNIISVQKPSSDPVSAASAAVETVAGTNQTKSVGSSAAPGAKPSSASAVSSSTVSATVVTPAPSTSSVTVPICLECGGNPDKVVSHTGTLQLSTNSFTVAQGSSAYGLATATASSGEAITQPYVGYTAGSPMIMAVVPWDSPTYSANRSFGFNVNQNVAPGTYTLTLRSTTQNQGAFTAVVTVIVVAAGS